jgi:hypothetical protein
LLEGIDNSSLKNRDPVVIAITGLVISVARPTIVRARTIKALGLATTSLHLSAGGGLDFGIL